MNDACACLCFRFRLFLRQLVFVARVGLSLFSIQDLDFSRREQKLCWQLRAAKTAQFISAVVNDPVALRTVIAHAIRAARSLQFVITRSGVLLEAVEAVHGRFEFADDIDVRLRGHIHAEAPINAVHKQSPQSLIL